MTREQSIRATFEIFKPEGVIEVRAMKDNKTFSGYYNDRARLVNDLAKHDDLTWYFVMNDIDEACYSREQHEKITAMQKSSKTTGDKEITSIRWLLVDADPVRPSGVGSTDAEKKKALDTIGKVFNYLRGIGFSEPVVCDSGNGYHLMYNVCLETADSAEVKKFLLALDMLFTDSAVSIDTTVYNPARITKVYGTIARKGANTKERPHRTSKILRIPHEIRPTSVSLIRKVGSVLPEPEKPTYSNGYRDRFDIDEFIHKHNLPVYRDTTAGGVRKIVLDCCPFDENHKAPDAALFVMGSGAIGFHCFHNSCQDKSWRDVRRLYEPTAYDRMEQRNRELAPQRVTVKPVQGEADHFTPYNQIQAIDTSKIVRVPTGIAGLDNKLGGCSKGELSIWSGGNGSGKSTMLSQIALEAIDRDFNVALFSGELTQGRVKDWLALQAAGRQNTVQSSNGLTYYVPQTVKDRIDCWIEERICVYNNDYGAKANSIVADFKAHVEKHQTDLVIIDNLMSMDLSEYRGEKYDRQSMLVAELSRLAKECDVHVHFVCHPRKPTGFLRKADISGSSDLTNAADNVFMMHRVNQDFVKTAGDFIGKIEAGDLAKFDNVVEIMKNRDIGVIDEFVGLYFEPQSKRLLNEPHENRMYGWEYDYSKEAFDNAMETVEFQELPSDDGVPF